MEPDARAFLSKVAKSLSVAFLWMMLNMTLGIFFDLGFIHQSVTLGNILFYVFLLATLTALVWYLLKLWKENLHA